MPFRLLRDSAFLESFMAHKRFANMNHAKDSLLWSEKSPFRWNHGVQLSVVEYLPNMAKTVFFPTKSMYLCLSLEHPVLSHTTRSLGDFRIEPIICHRFSGTHKIRKTLTQAKAFKGASHAAAKKGNNKHFRGIIQCKCTVNLRDALLFCWWL